GRNDARHAPLREVPDAGQLQHRQMMPLGNGPHFIELRSAGFDPTRGPKRAMILRAELVTGPHVVMEQTAIINHARDDFDALLLRSRKNKAARPRFERVENDHRPIDQVAEFFKARNQMESDSIGWT